MNAALPDASQLRNFIFCICSYFYIKNCNSCVGTSHILKLWMLASSTRECKSCKNRCT